jgi:hypothetical protein
VAGRRRGRYSEAFKTQVVTAARQPGVSTAAAALARIERQPAAPLDFRPRSATSESVIHIEPQRAGTTVFDSALAPGLRQLRAQVVDLIGLGVKTCPYKRLICWV